MPSIIAVQPPPMRHAPAENDMHMQLCGWLSQMSPLAVEKHGYMDVNADMQSAAWAGLPAYNMDLACTSRQKGGSLSRETLRNPWQVSGTKEDVPALV